MEARVVAYFKALSQYLPGETEEKQTQHQQKEKHVSEQRFEHRTSLIQNRIAKQAVVKFHYR
jgi:hypothetical protein